MVYQPQLYKCISFHTTGLSQSFLGSSLGMEEWKTPFKIVLDWGTTRFFGVLLMSSGGQEKSFSIWGDALALIGGMLGAAYFIIGKRARQDLDIYTYGSWTCLASAVWLGLLALFQNTSLIVETIEWKYLIYMALGPQLLGHIGLNYVLKYVSASFISMLLLFEPVGAGILAWLFLKEVPHSFTIAGATVVMFGLTYVILYTPNKANT